VIYTFVTETEALRAFEQIRAIYAHQCVVGDWIDEVQGNAEIELEYLRLIQRAEAGERGVAHGATTPVTPVRRGRGLWTHRSCSGNTRFAWQKCMVEYVCLTPDDARPWGRDDRVKAALAKGTPWNQDQSEWDAEASYSLFWW